MGSDNTHPFDTHLHANSAWLQPVNAKSCRIVASRQLLADGGFGESDPRVVLERAACPRCPSLEAIQRELASEAALRPSELHVEFVKISHRSKYYCWALWQCIGWTVKQDEEDWREWDFVCSSAAELHAELLRRWQQLGSMAPHLGDEELLFRRDDLDDESSEIEGSLEPEKVGISWSGFSFTGERPVERIRRASKRSSRPRRRVAASSKPFQTAITK